MERTAVSINTRHWGCINARHRESINAQLGLGEKDQKRWASWCVNLHFGHLHQPEEGALDNAGLALPQPNHPFADTTITRRT